MQLAKIEMRRRLTLIGSRCCCTQVDVDGLICGTWGTTGHCTSSTSTRLSAKSRVSPSTPQRMCAFTPAMNGLMLPGRQVFLVDTHVNYDPTRRRVVPKSPMHGRRRNDALWSEAQSGIAVPFQLWFVQPAQRHQDAPKPRVAESQQAPWLEVEGEMHGDVALDGDARQSNCCPTAPCSRARPTCWCCPTLTQPTSPTTCSKPLPAATLPSARCCSGAAKPVHVLTASTTVRRIVNMTRIDRGRRQCGTLRPSQLASTNLLQARF
jgi:malate dehydrogenase (oxaloacetate-decarboxylating)(NADP+)